MKKTATQLYYTLIFTVVALLFLIIPQVGFASEAIKSYEVDIQVNADATLDITETIHYDFGDTDRHGIFRDIPVRYQSDEGIRRSIDIEPVRVQRDGGEENYEFWREGGQVHFKIGDPNRTIFGLHTYSIEYRVDRAITYFEDVDEVYWNAVGGGWDVPIEYAVVTVIPPEGYDSSAVMQNTCYIGALGSTEVCKYGMINDSDVGYVSHRPLGPGESFTVAVGFAKGVLYEPTQLERTIAAIVRYLIFLFPLAMFIVLFRVWRRHGRNPKEQTIIPQYEPPADLKPFFMGVVVDAKVDPRDISAGIIYLAEQGYLHIKRIEKKWFLGSADYEFTLKNIDRIGSHEQEILDILFAQYRSGWFGNLTISGPLNQLVVGQQVKLSDLKKNTVAQKIQAFGKSAQKDLFEQGYYDKESKGIKEGLIIGGFIGMVLGNVLVGAFSSYEASGVAHLAIILAFLIMIIFGLMMGRPTEKGQRTREHIKGFKDFLATTEKDRYEFHNAPEKSPEQFMEYLPYAIALGVEKKWAEQFKDITIQEPSWYSGSAAYGAVMVNPSLFVSDLSGFTAVMNSGFASGASGSSASGGGGFSGGGAGGGGGGSW